MPSGYGNSSAYQSRFTFLQIDPTDDPGNPSLAHRLGSRTVATLLQKACLPPRGPTENLECDMRYRGRIASICFRLQIWQRQLAHLPQANRRKEVNSNPPRLVRFPSDTDHTVAAAAAVAVPFNVHIKWLQLTEVQ